MNRTPLSHDIEPLGAEWRCVADIQSMVGEGPLYNTIDGCFYFVDIGKKLIHRYMEGEPLRSILTTEMVTAIVPCAVGGMLITLERTVAFFDPATGTVDGRRELGSEPFSNRFNDGKCDRRGRFWAGSMSKTEWAAPVGALYMFDGDKPPQVKVKNVRCSNGLGWSPDNRTFYFTESFAHTIWAFDFNLDSGEISQRRVFATLDPASGAFPDGLTVDVEGFVWSAQPVFGRLVRYHPSGAIDRIIETPVSRPTSCAFGGVDMATLYVTSATDSLSPNQLLEEPLAGGLFAVRPGVSGLPEVPFAGGTSFSERV